jgi:radical SAM superfamily enzyme YgiQ (UPF0313 family)
MKWIDKLFGMWYAGSGLKGCCFFMKRNILLVEPDYKTKFPPLGLMKISAYHKELGDKVTFVKGISQSAETDSWEQSAEMKTWNRIYVSTLFTYYWQVTVKTIKHYKALVRDDPRKIVIGGILASLMPDEIWDATGIKPITGVLSDAGAFSMLDEKDDNKLVVDEMIPDYELFDDVSHKYSLINDSFFGYSTRGCPNKCEFCGVNKLEPKFKDYKGIKPYVNKIRDKSTMKHE